jgi:chemotaxis protein CheD
MVDKLATKEAVIVVGLGEVQISRDPAAVLTCLGLGSCIGLSAYDPVSRVAGMAHIVLPASDGKNGPLASRYADVAVPALLEELRKLGALSLRLVVKLAGGAQMSKSPGHQATFQIGERNYTAVQGVLSQHRIAVAKVDVGGNRGRTMRLYVESGRATVTTVGLESKEL